jgi:hypothetical protein
VIALLWRSEIKSSLNDKTSKKKKRRSYQSNDREGTETLGLVSQKRE